MSWGTLKSRVWHGLCHDDDALMSPVDTNHFDGYISGSETLTRFEPLDPVPGLNSGGWHDASFEPVLDSLNFVLGVHPGENQRQMHAFMLTILFRMTRLVSPDVADIWQSNTGPSYKHE